MGMKIRRGNIQSTLITLECRKVLDHYLINKCSNTFNINDILEDSLHDARSSLNRLSSKFSFYYPGRQASKSFENGAHGPENLLLNCHVSEGIPW